MRSLPRGALLFAVVAACGGSTKTGGPDTGGTTPEVDAGTVTPEADGGSAAFTCMGMMTDSGMYCITVQTDPAPVVRGTNSVIYSITDAKGVPADGLTFTVVPWMPAHGHGTSLKPMITPMGNGVYRIDNCLFFMPGRWELRTTVTMPAMDHVTPSFDVP